MQRHDLASLLAKNFKDTTQRFTEHFGKQTDQVELTLKDLEVSTIFDDYDTFLEFKEGKKLWKKLRRSIERAPETFELYEV